MQIYIIFLTMASNTNASSTPSNPTVTNGITVQPGQVVQTISGYFMVCVDPTNGKPMLQPLSFQQPFMGHPQPYQPFMGQPQPPFMGQPQPYQPPFMGQPQSPFMVQPQPFQQRPFSATLASASSNAQGGMLTAQTILRMVQPKKIADAPDEQEDADAPDEQEDADAPDEQEDADAPDEQEDADAPDEQEDADAPDEQEDADAPEENIHQVVTPKPASKTRAWANIPKTPSILLSTSSPWTGPEISPEAVATPADVNSAKTVEAYCIDKSLYESRKTRRPNTSEEMHAKFNKIAEQKGKEFAAKHIKYVDAVSDQLYQCVETKEGHVGVFSRNIEVEFKDQDGVYYTKTFSEGTVVPFDVYCMYEVGKHLNPDTHKTEYKSCNKGPDCPAKFHLTGHAERIANRQRKEEEFAAKKLQEFAPIPSPAEVLEQQKRQKKQKEQEKPSATSEVVISEEDLQSNSFAALLTTPDETAATESTVLPKQHTSAVIDPRKAQRQKAAADANAAADAKAADATSAQPQVLQRKIVSFEMSPDEKTAAKRLAAEQEAARKLVLEQEQAQETALMQAYAQEIVGIADSIFRATPDGYVFENDTQAISLKRGRVLESVFYPAGTMRPKNWCSDEKSDSSSEHQCHQSRCKASHLDSFCTRFSCEQEPATHEPTTQEPAMHEFTE